MTEENIPAECGGKADVVLSPGGSVKEVQKTGERN